MSSSSRWLSDCSAVSPHVQLYIYNCLNLLTSDSRRILNDAFHLLLTIFTQTVLGPGAGADLKDKTFSTEDICACQRRKTTDIIDNSPGFVCADSLSWLTWGLNGTVPLLTKICFVVFQL